MNGYKICPSCKIAKPPTEYYPSKASKDGLTSYCKECNSNIKKKKRKLLVGCYKYERRIIKSKVVSRYSNGANECKACGFNDIRALSIDHVNNDGNTHRKELGKKNLYKWLISNNYPDGFQVLCMNCQFIKRYEYYQEQKKQGAVEEVEEFEE